MFKKSTTIELDSIYTCDLITHDIYIEEIDGEYHPEVDIPHRHSFFEIMWSTRNGGEHIVDFKSYPIHKDELYFMAPGRVHSINTYEKEGFIIMLSSDFLAQLLCSEEDSFFSLFYTFGSESSFILSVEEKKHLSMLFFLFFEEYKREKEDKRLLQSYCRTFLLYAQRLIEQKNSDGVKRNKDRIGILYSLIEQHYKSEKLVDYYAHELALTSKHLNELTKESVGLTVSQIIRNRIIIEAKRELYFNEASINQISYHLGYNDPAYFSRFFKKETGVSPKVYQNESRCIY